MTTNRDAYREIVAARLAAGWSHENAAAQGDAFLALMEQREREGRFGSVGMFTSEERTAEFRDLTANRDEWMERAQRAEAEVGRLEAELIAKTDSAEALAHEWENAKQRAAKAESLLKEALGALRWERREDREKDGAECLYCHGDDLCPSHAILARARREGFSDGE